MLRAPSLHCLDAVHHELFKMAEDVCDKVSLSFFLNFHVY